MVKAELLNMEYLRIQEGEQVYYGGDQAWYPERWKQQAGCGPTNGAALVWYREKSHAALKPEALSPDNKQEFIALMLEVWEYITPGAMGVNSTEIFTSGMQTYCREKGIEAAPRGMKIPARWRGKRSWKQTRDFILEALAENRPLAFLNLSHGKVKELESWHWVLIVAMEEEKVQLYDQGRSYWIHLRRWLETSWMGGGLVYLDE